MKVMIGGGLLFAFSIGFVVGHYVPARSDEPLAVIPAGAIPDAAIDRYRVPIEHAPVKGSDKAKVTIVQFSDFQCPYCGMVERTIDEIVAKYGRNVRVVWKNNPLPFHDRAMPAAQLAVAAAERGKFWEMHDKLFKHQQTLDRANLEKYAREVGLDAAAIKEALDDGKHASAIKSDQQQAAKLGASGTPSFFINGRPISGAQPLASFTKIIDQELANADKAIHAGVPVSQLYDALTRNAKLAAAPEPAAPAQAAAPEDNTVYKAELGDAPVRGGHNAKVTIVEFSDFECPFCGRVEPTLSKLLDVYKGDLRIVFKQLPLPFHRNAHLAAEATLAAKAQGRFWEMHDKLMSNQQSLERASLEKYAAEIGLNVARFKSDLDSGKWRRGVDAELAQGSKVGARGTPSFFINGKLLVGAQPLEVFQAKIDEERKHADAIVKAGTPIARLYDVIMKDAKNEAAAAAPPATGDAPEDTRVYKVDAGNAPSMGPRTAPVTIVEFSDFQCPFCSRVVETIRQLEDKYRGKVRVAFRNYPLPFHQHAQLAAEVAMAANEQGKFWQMHDKLFANQEALDEASLEKYAANIGLDMGRFKSDLSSGRLKSAISADVAYANGLGDAGFGTPTFFINGRKISGAMPFDSFAKLIDEELAKKGVRVEHAALVMPR